ncbi:MAG: PepSY domain-containing protein [Oscillospiraceae bacterium]
MKQKWILTGTALALAAALAGCGSNAPTSSQPQSSQQASYISMDAAQSAALDAASIAAADANFSATTLDDVAGITCYKVDFSAGGYDYAYSINAESGEVLEASYHEQAGAAALPDGSTGTTTTQPSTTKPNVGAVTTTPAQTTPSTNTSTGAVTEAKAQEIALAHAGIKAADATITKSKLDYDDGRQIYEIEWYANGAKYDYEIAVATGEIVNSGYEAKTVVGTGSSATVSEATAKQTALARVSGATDKDIYEWKLDYDDGRPEYEGKIIYGGTEYEFTIDAASGNVTEWEAETLNR